MIRGLSGPAPAPVGRGLLFAANAPDMAGVC